LELLQFIIDIEESQNMLLLHAHAQSVLACKYFIYCNTKISPCYYSLPGYKALWFCGNFKSF